MGWIASGARSDLPWTGLGGVGSSVVTSIGPWLVRNDGRSVRVGRAVGRRTSPAGRTKPVLSQHRRTANEMGIGPSLSELGIGTFPRLQDSHIPEKDEGTQPDHPEVPPVGQIQVAVEEHVHA